MCVEYGSYQIHMGCLFWIEPILVAKMILDIALKLAFFLIFDVESIPIFDTPLFIFQCPILPEYNVWNLSISIFLLLLGEFWQCSMLTVLIKWIILSLIRNSTL